MNRRGTNRKTELIIWGVSGLLVLVLPIGAVMLEGKTKSTKKPTTAQKSEQKNATRPAATSPARAVSRRPFVETEPAPGRSDWYSGVVPVTPVAAKQDVERSTVATPAPVNSAPFITEASTPEIRDSSATPASVGPGSLNPVETASAVGTISTGDASLSSMGPLATEPSVTVELPMQAPEKPVTTPAVVQMPDHTPAMSDPDSSVAVTIPEPEMLEER